MRQQARLDVGGDDQQLHHILNDQIEATEIGDTSTCVRGNLPADTGFDVVSGLSYATTGGDIGIPRAVIRAIRQQFVRGS